jgi:hypothetical protein
MIQDLKKDEAHIQQLRQQFLDEQQKARERQKNETRYERETLQTERRQLEELQKNCERQKNETRRERDALEAQKRQLDEQMNQRFKKYMPSFWREEEEKMKRRGVQEMQPETMAKANNPQNTSVHGSSAGGFTRTHAFTPIAKTEAPLVFHPGTGQTFHKLEIPSNPWAPEVGASQKSLSILPSRSYTPPSPPSPANSLDLYEEGTSLRPEYGIGYYSKII